VQAHFDGLVVEVDALVRAADNDRRMLRQLTDMQQQLTGMQQQLTAAQRQLTAMQRERDDAIRQKKVAEGFCTEEHSARQFQVRRADHFQCELHKTKREMEAKCERLTRIEACMSEYIERTGDTWFFPPGVMPAVAQLQAEVAQGALERAAKRLKAVDGGDVDINKLHPKVNMYAVSKCPKAP
jgi:chromosome segregation ATPase